MLYKAVTGLFENATALRKWGKTASNYIHQVVLDGGPPARQVADLLHGTWLGHPLHPLLTDVVIGAWVLGGLMDLASLGRNSKQAEQAADGLTTIGTAAAVPTILSGLADFSTIPNPAAGVGLTHAVLNDVAFSLYLLSIWARRKGQRGGGIALSMAGLGTSMAAAYLGGHLVYDYKVGVNRKRQVAGPKEWTAVLSDADLPQNEPKRIEIDEEPVLLYRCDGRITAVSAVCPHAGGPLDEGQFHGCQVECPWHDSVFDLRDGRVVHGPSPFPVPRYDTRLRDGQVEIRAAG